MFSVVIPAHNEAAMMAACLEGVLGQASGDDIEVIVVCNGCTDETAAIARASDNRVTVLEIEKASKSAALNVGDAAATRFPRFYLDADVVVTTADLRAMAAAMSAPGLLATTTCVHVDASRSSRVVASYSRFWVRLPAIRDGLCGRGVYGVSEAGRRRFERFPDAFADDLFIDGLFSDGTGRPVPRTTSVVTAPRGTRDLVRAKTRVFIGNAQLDALQATAEPGRPGGWQRVVRTEPGLVLDAPAYLAITAVAKMRARIALRRKAQPIWGGRGAVIKDRR